MNGAWIYLIYIIVGLFMADIFFNLLYDSTTKEMKAKGIIAQIYYGLHFMGFVMCLIGVLGAFRVAYDEVHG